MSIMTNDEINLGDIPALPDFSSFVETGTQWETGWYKGVILEERVFTDKNGNDRVFQSSDEPAQRSGRNIRLQVELTRADGKKLNLSWLVNYDPDHLTQDTIQQVMQRKEEGGEYGDLFRAFMSLQRMGKFQRVAGRNLARNGNGGLDLHVLFGKQAYFRIKPDERSQGKYMEVADIRSIEDRPSKVL